MIISHNMSALNVKNVIRKNDKAGSASLEKLSSGLRINRAADDAAGLSVSEKMRAQIRGLHQATRNVQDGISLIQTAEGGMQEITDIIQRQKELLVQGLNGTYSDEDKQKIDNEIRQLNEAINSMSARAKFNEIPLLANDSYQIIADRSGSSTASTISDPAPTSTISTTIVYKPKGTPEEARHQVSSQDSSLTTTAYSNTNTLTEIRTPDGIDGFNEYNVDTYTTTKTDTNTTVYESLTAASDPQYTQPGYWYSVGSNETLFGPKNFGSVYGSMFENIEVNGVSRPVEYGARSSVGTVPATEYWMIPGTNVSITRYRTVLPDNSMEVRYDIRNSDTSNATVTLSNRIDPPRNSNISDNNGNPLPPGNQVIDPPWGSAFQMAGDEANASISFDDASGLTAPDRLKIANPAAGQPQIDFEWQLNLAPGSSVTLGFKYGPLSLNYDVFEKSTETIVTKHIESEVRTEIKDVDFIAPRITIQAGVHAGDTIDIPLFIVNTDGLGIDQLGILPPADPGVSLSRADRALSKVTGFRGIYGALQNRMEHAMSNTANSAINLTAAESRIRDTDMAKEMMNLTRTNVLTQVAQAMLVQANQNPQTVLQLLK